LKEVNELKKIPNSKILDKRKHVFYEFLKIEHSEYKSPIGFRIFEKIFYLIIKLHVQRKMAKEKFCLRIGKVG